VVKRQTFINEEYFPTLMQRREAYHTANEYAARGLDPFLEHTRAYLEGNRTIPVAKATSIDSPKGVRFTFSDELLHRFANRPKEMQKPYEAAVKFGFRGHSRGGRNGIFYQGKSRKMTRKTEKLITAHSENLTQDLDIAKEGLDGLRRVKIVWHNPSGGRIVGAYNTQNHRMMFLGFAYY